MVESFIGRLERLMLTLGIVEFRIRGENLKSVAEVLTNEGFIESNKGILIESLSWSNSFSSISTDSIKIVYPTEVHFLKYLGADIIPPNSFEVPHLELPSVSVITPIFNSERYFKRYIDQIKSIDYPKELLEIVIVDDGSFDKELPRQLVKELSKTIPKVRLHRNPSNQGIFFSKMTGAQIAANEYITFWDVDDQYDPLQIKLLAVHNELLRLKGFSNFLISSPSVIIEFGSYKTVAIWKTPYKNPVELLLESMLTLRGRVSITSSLLRRGVVVRTYDILVSDYNILKMVPKLSVPEDTILVNQMIIEGCIKKVFPISYTARGHIRGSENTSDDVLRRVKEIPAFVAILIDWFCKSSGEVGIMKLFESNMHTFRRSLAAYGDMSGSFLRNLFDYLKSINEDCGKVFESTLPRFLR